VTDKLTTFRNPQGLLRLVMRLLYLYLYLYLINRGQNGRGFGKTVEEINLQYYPRTSLDKVRHERETEILTGR
jgi:hypothetical protein